MVTARVCGERRSKEKEMEKLEIIAQKRTTIGKQVSVLRREGKLPGVIYGHKFEPTAIVMDLKEATRVLSLATSSSLVTILLEGKPLSVLVRERQRDYLRNQLTHVDFQSVSLTEKIRANVNIELDGIAPAVKDFDGVIVEGLNSIHVEALPTDLPERFIVDISVLKEIGDSILVKDLVIPTNVEVLTPEDELIVLITSPAAEEMEEVEEELEPEVIEKGKKEEEE
jgi:large subunit ribosomal protein L25